MGYIRDNADYYHSVGRPDLAEREVVLEYNEKHPHDKKRVPGNYVGSKGTVEQQPDNPCAPTDD